jgi:hypothetical protein
MIENYFVNQRSLGFDHPRMLALRERIKELTDSDFQFDLNGTVRPWRIDGVS